MDWLGDTWEFDTHFLFLNIKIKPFILLQFTNGDFNIVNAGFWMERKLVFD